MKIYNALSYAISYDLKHYSYAIRRVLMSYWAIMSSEKSNVAAIEKDEKFHGEMFLDSGAFSAFTKGVNINIDEYVEFAKKYKNKFAVVANLDVIGDHDLSMRNQRYIEDNGVSPIPVFHCGSDYGLLKELSQEYPYIALGGLVPFARYRDKLSKHLDKCFSIIRTDTKAHLFGITSKWVLERYPAFSADSTSSFEGSRRGTVSCFLSNKRLDPRTNVNAFGMMDKDDGQKLYRDRVAYMLLSTQKLEDYITALWAKRGITWTD